MHNDAVMALIILPTLSFFFGWVVWTFVDGRRRWLTVRARTEFYNRMMDKFSSAREFIDFSQTEGGLRFLETFSTERVGPMDRILGSVQKGAILSIVGLGFLFLGWRYRFDEDVLTIIGTVLLALGVGFLVSAGISYRLSKEWGLISGVESGRRGELVSRP
ncbi:MAG: hypothetical protein DMG06_18595 [Acidobacteria bacterium]|nr:MAG: hypothetical protein DMG06_18595 [Acidobacteriota bacterium]